MAGLEKVDWTQVNITTRKLPVETGWLYETSSGIAWVSDPEAPHVKMLAAARKAEVAQDQCSPAPVSRAFKDDYSSNLSWPYQ